MDMNLHVGLRLKQANPYIQLVLRRVSCDARSWVKGLLVPVIAIFWLAATIRGD